MNGDEALATPRRDYWNSLSSDQVAGVLDRLSDGIVVLDADWRYRYVSEQTAEMLGSSPEELIGRRIWDLFTPEAALPFRAVYESVARDREPARIVAFYEPWGRWFENRVLPHEDGIIVLFRDATEEQSVQEELREYAERMAQAERIVRFGVWKWDLESGRVRWSDQLHRIYGIEPGEFPETVDSFLERLHPDDRERVWGEISRSMETREPFIFEERIIRPGGEVRVLLSQGHPIVAPDGTLASLVGVCHDITDRASMERALGNSERRLHAIVDNTPSVITVKDLSGRYVMANAEAARLFGVEPGEIVGRDCTDFFPPDISEAQRANEQLAAAEGSPVYDELILVRDGSPRSYLNVTFPLPDEDGRTAEICTIATDVTESREREEDRLERTTWTKRIDSALAEDRLVAFAQPIIDLASGRVVSVELLARMLTGGESPEVLTPAAFLPSAERYGLIQKIDRRMVERALALPGEAHTQVNLSAVTLCDADARSQIVDLLRGSREAARRIVFEITETAVPEHFEAACGFAREVTALGARLALDDFGTGFGSLTYLDALPLSYLKIDLSFVRGLSATRENRRLVESIIGIAGVFELKTIAEGVEDETTLELLRDLGADFAQGFHLGRPAPLPFAAALEDRPARAGVS